MRPSRLFFHSLLGWAEFFTLLSSHRTSTRMNAPRQPGTPPVTTVAVIGLGYVGLPLCLTFARGGLSVIGIDVDLVKVEHLRAGTSYISHIPAAASAPARRADSSPRPTSRPSPVPMRS